jgi:nitrogen fixation NifU-like protein
MNEKLKELYRTVILAHNEQPYHFINKEEAGYILEAYNPLCGDRFRFFFEVKNDTIQDVYFHGFGCAISKASSSVLVKSLENQPFERAVELCKSFLKMTDPALEEGVTMTNEYTAFTAVKNFPARLKCVTLGWEEVLKFLENNHKVQS